MVRISDSAWLAVGLLALTPMAWAQSGSMPGDFGKRGGFIVETDFDFGGDRLATVSFVNGDTQSLRAGQGITLSVGGYFRPADSPFELRGSLGYKYATAAASNADINVTRVVLQFIGDYRFENGAYFGGGLAMHNGAKLDGDGFFQNVDFDDATGIVIEAGWRWVGVHYTNIKYSNPFIQSVDASHFGVRLNYRF